MRDDCWVLVPFAPGGYRFLRASGRPFSSGVVADPGFDLVRASFERPVPIDQGLAAARRHLEAAGRPLTAIAGLELRLPDVLTPDGFDSFNQRYAARLTELGLSDTQGMPAARTNVAPTTAPVGEVSLFAFSYTVRSARPGAAFVLSGAAETRRDGAASDRLGSIVEALEARMSELGVSWADTSAVNLYAASASLTELLPGVLDQLGSHAVRGITWLPSLPPVTGLQFEIDARGVGTELTLPVAAHL